MLCGMIGIMQVTVGPGTYVLAASGGVDSMVLLDILHKKPGVKLIVAHFDHGIREDSDKDRKLVEKTAKAHGLPFVYHKASLGSGTSEAKAREARYEFLHKVRKSTGAKAIITAHHEDDVLETAIMNLLRGSGRRGLTSLRSTDGIVRPLLAHSKDRIRDHASAYAVAWREDSTNKDTQYKRNYIRANILPKLSAGQRAQLVILVEDLRRINDELDASLSGLLHIQPAPNTLDKKCFINLPHSVAKEVIHTWLRHRNIKDVTKKTIERLVAGIKTGKAGQKLDLDQAHQLYIDKDVVVLKTSRS